MLNAVHHLSKTSIRLLALVFCFGAHSACGGEGPFGAQEIEASTTADLALGLGAQSCDYAGTWAVKFETPVSWRFNMGIASGTGTIEHWALTRRRVVDGHTIEEEVRPCGSTIPTYRALPIYGGEQYGVALPDALFDSGILPTLKGTTWISGDAPGAMYNVSPIPLTLGVNLPHPETDLWPKRMADLTPYLIDTDADGNPGVTTFARDDGDLVLPPVNTSKSHRASRFFIALRNVIGARGKVITCDHFEGTTVVATVGGKPAMASTILGCELSDKSFCSRGQATLANTFQPVYQVSDKSRSVMVRVQDDVTCAQVRAMPF